MSFSTVPAGTSGTISFADGDGRDLNGIAGTSVPLTTRSILANPFLLTGAQLGIFIPISLAGLSSLLCPPVTSFTCVPAAPTCAPFIGGVPAVSPFNKITLGGCI